MTAALLGFLVVFALAFLRVPLAVAMTIAGLGGLGLMRGWQPAFASTSQVIFETGFAYVLSVIPLFVLMGNLVARAANLKVRASPDDTASAVLLLDKGVLLEMSEQPSSGWIAPAWPRAADSPARARLTST